MFVERKTHHEDWTGETSVKERMAIEPSAAPALLRGECAIAQQVDRMVERGEVRAAEAQKATQLGDEVQRAIVRSGMRPVIRSVYNRRAFQSSTTNDVSASSHRIASHRMA